MSSKIIAALETWGLVHVDIIGSYTKSKRQQHAGGAIIQHDVSLT